MKSLMVFAHTLLNELGEWCQVSTARDWKTVESRVEHEGISFLTISLPDFGKSFEKSLADGRVTSSTFAPMWGFHGGVPKFLSGFLGLVFSTQDGVLLDHPSIAAIRAIRQFSLAFGKIGLECSDERTKKALLNYLECEKEIRANDKNLDPVDREEFERIGALLWASTFSELDGRLSQGDYLPRHGPGATADGLRGNAKYYQLTWPNRLEAVFPYLENAAASWSQYVDLDHVDFLEPGRETPVKVITVPKTLKTPRIIAEEPTAMQYMQQAIHEIMQEAFRRIDIPRNFICYDSQIPNQEMARVGSLTEEFATLDLSEASDRVSNEHVRALLRNHPHLFEAVDATRSRKARVLSKKFGLDQTVRLAKFASMGSALCFPMEALVFTTVVFLGIQKSLGHQLTKNNIKSFFGRVRVYGDDIIVPIEHASSVVSALEAFGFKVNHSKSFWTGKFRESCGADYFAGYDVSVTRVRSMLPSSRRDASELVSTVALRNNLASQGYTRVVDYLDGLISSIIPFPKVGIGSPILGRVDLDGVYDVDKMHPDYHIPLVRGMVVRNRLPINEVDGYAALLKWYLKRGSDPFAEVNHLKRSGRPVSVDIKHGYGPAHGLIDVSMVRTGAPTYGRGRS